MVDDLKQVKLDWIKAQTEQAVVQTAKDRFDLRNKEAGDRTRIYNFNDYIVSGTVETCVEVIQHWVNMDPNRLITVSFNSPGGSVFEGFALYDFIVDNVANGVPINTTGYGKVASMAGICLQAGQERSLHNNAFLMIHEVSSFVEGTRQALKDQLAFTESLAERCEDVLISRADVEKITKEDLHSKTVHKDWWLTPEEALNFGFIDRIV